MRRLLTNTALVLGLLSPSVSQGAEFYNDTIDGTEVILISGVIVEGDEERFRELSIQHPKAVVGLSSQGGQLVPALEIGRLVRLRGYETIVLDGDTCASSCALIWMAGSKKTLVDGARLGFHASYLDNRGRRVESGAANALIGRYLTQLNYSEDTVLFATLASPDEIWWLDDTTKELSGIAYVVHSGQRKTTPTPPPIRTYSIPAPAPTARQPATLKEILRADNLAADAATSLGATGKLHQRMTEHLTLLYADDYLVDRMEKELNAAKLDFRKDPQQSGALMFRLSTSMMMHGMSRLPQRDVDLFFNYLSFISQAEGPNCEVSLDTTGRVNLTEFQIVSRLGDDGLRDYMSLLRRAILAEAAQFPAKVVLDDSKTAMAENAWAEVLVEQIDRSGWSIEDFEALVAAFDNPNEKNLRQRCAGLKVMVPAVAKMEGLVGDWYRRIYLTYVQDAS